jgi:hypothetical protein
MNCSKRDVVSLKSAIACQWGSCQVVLQIPSEKSAGECESVANTLSRWTTSTIFLTSARPTAWKMRKNNWTAAQYELLIGPGTRS